MLCSELFAMRYRIAFNPTASPDGVYQRLAKLYAEDELAYALLQRGLQSSPLGHLCSPGWSDAFFRFTCASAGESFGYANMEVWATRIQKLLVFN